MGKNNASALLNAINKIAAVLVLFCSLLLFLDYLLPGSLEEVVIQEYDVFTTRVRGGSATTYNIITEKYTFPISDEFLSASEVGDTINVEVSRMLEIIDAYGLRNQRASHVYYTRYLTGIFFPLALILVSLIALRLREPSETTLNMLIGLEAMALFIFFMTLVNISNLF
ncbi:hypothetical protein AAE02nite_32480 [Adhaeribacter aerolatus]|uniref:Uncharacterized protein n=1 Tax=Adhaeribacter aerolatus TaxID=670289 RepID=A0A512B0U6_9BACT|nr:hypothetical protein [Adhaeribacter aerolatus]GEO05584.1 hypothetical protein AAE02nite_32480 [Adhaeribacter aerolatus]